MSVADWRPVRNYGGFLEDLRFSSFPRKLESIPSISDLLDSSFRRNGREALAPNEVIQTSHCGVERVMGIEPTTTCLGSKSSTTELHPLVRVSWPDAGAGDSAGRTRIC